MRNLKILAISATLLVASASLALAGGACDSKASAETASAATCDKSAETAATKTAGAGCSSSAETAAVKTAGAGCSSSAATAETANAATCDKSAESAATKTASAGCSSSASTAAVKTAGAGCSSSASTAAVKTAGAGCSSSAMQTAGAGCDSKSAMAKAIKVETVRMPSGAMAVFYNGTNAESIAYLQASAEKDCGGFACNIAKGMAADEECKVEMAKTEHGVMMLVTSEKTEVVEKYAAQYAAITTSSEQGE